MLVSKLVYSKLYILSIFFIDVQIFVLSDSFLEPLAGKNCNDCAKTPGWDFNIAFWPQVKIFLLKNPEVVEIQ